MRRLSERLLHEYKPQLVVLAAGVRPQMGTLDEFSWETFSIPWNADTQAAFHLLKAALTLPLAPGSTVAIVSSGAAVAGSPLSGGYAGAKRMQWFMAEYAQEVSDAKKLGIRFFAVLPRQLIEGTEIGNTAATNYGAAQGYRRRSFSSVAGRCRSTPIKSVRQSSTPCEEISPTASPQSG